MIVMKFGGTSVAGAGAKSGLSILVPHHRLQLRELRIVRLGIHIRLR